MSTFLSRLSETMDSFKDCTQTNNWDYRRFGMEPQWRTRPFWMAKASLKIALMRLGVFKGAVVGQVDSYGSQFDWLYERLKDDESKQTLLSVIAFRALRHTKVRLPLNTPAYWNKLAELEQRMSVSDSIELGFNGWKLNRIDMRPDGYPLDIYAQALYAYSQLVIEQYRCQSDDLIIEARAGDVVIDAGGCYGETALYFAHKAGAHGKVYSFEFMPDNLAIFKRNLQINPELAGKIHIVEHPLWSESGLNLFIDGIGPSARVTPSAKNPSAQQAVTLTIDDLVKNRGIDKVDFIKMDIEGAELEALKGSTDSIRKFRPILAISVYHRLHDFWEIPKWIDRLDLGYHLYLRHFTIHSEETVLFAVPPA